MKRIITTSKGVTLLELLTTISIIMIIATLLSSSIRSAREKSYQAQCLNNERQLVCAVLMFSYDESRFPETLASLDGRYLESPAENTLSVNNVAYADTNPGSYYGNHASLLQCPKADTEGLSISYGYNVYLRNVNYSIAEDASDVIVLADSNKQFLLSANDSVKRHRRGLNAAFVDGHVKYVDSISPYPFTVSEPDERDDQMDSDDQIDGGGEGVVDPESVEGQTMEGQVNINPNNNSDFQFDLKYLDLVHITRDDLHNNRELSYTGQASYIMLQPKGNGNQNTLVVGGQPYDLQNGHVYVITSDDLTVKLYNDKAGSKGKAMGHWWLDSIEGTNVIIEDLGPGHD